MVIRACKFWMERYEAPSKQLRDVESNLQWSLAQQNGDFMSCCAATVGLLTSPADLEWIGFVMPSQRFSGATLDEVEVAAQGELASCTGHFALQLLACNLRRHLWLLRGRPGLMLQFLASSDQAAKAIRLFQSDLPNFIEFTTQHTGSTHASAITKRSIFR